MSHKATNWFSEVPADALTSGEFRVLFFLADCHNPSKGCFPEQKFLRVKTGLSNGGLNKCLNGLETKKLIRRKQRFNPQTKERLSTLYILGCDEDLDTEPTPLSGDGANSTFDADPSPLLGQTQLHPSGDKPVREPVKEPCASETDPQTNAFSKDLTEQLLELHPRPGDPIETEAALKKAIAAGTSPEVIISGARAYAEEQKGNSPRYVAYSQNWVTRKGWVPFAPKSAADISANADAVNTRWANWIKAKAVSAVHCSPRVAHQLCLDGKVTVAECRAAGINL